MAKVTGLPEANIDPEKLACGSLDNATCAETFEQNLASYNGDLATSLSAVAHQMVEVSRDIHVVVWTPRVNGVAQPALTTLSGRVRDQLIGIIVFR